MTRPDAQITACPKCGDRDAGFQLVVTERHVYRGDWGEGFQYGDCERILPPKTVKCSSCGARININTAVGGEVSGWIRK